MLSSESPDRVPVDEIAEAAGISRGLLFHYFPTKRDFYVAVAREAARQLLEVTEPDPTLHHMERLHASLAEGIPNVVLEAMACGVPVVTTDAGGVAEAVTDGVEGFVVPARRPELMAAALERLWREPELAARMGAAGRERVSRSFRADAQIEQFLDLYAGVTAP